jgi:hypothetical protein
LTVARIGHQSSNFKGQFIRTAHFCKGADNVHFTGFQNFFFWKRIYFNWLSFCHDFTCNFAVINAIFPAITPGKNREKAGKKPAKNRDALFYQFPRRIPVSFAEKQPNLAFSLVTGTRFCCAAPF